MSDTQHAAMARLIDGSTSSRVPPRPIELLDGDSPTKPTLPPPAPPAACSPEVSSKLASMPCHLGPLLQVQTCRGAEEAYSSCEVLAGRTDLSPKKKGTSWEVGDEWVSSIMHQFDMSTIVEGECLNDEVVNGMMMILRASMRTGAPGFARCFFMTSFFYNMLYADDSRYNYDKVRRHTNPRKMLRAEGVTASIFTDFDLVLFPVHLGNHWICVVVNMQAHAVEVYDSSSNAYKEDSQQVGEHVVRWVGDEYAATHDGKQPPDRWRLQLCEACPQQNDCSSCGVFAVLAAMYRAMAKDWDYDQSHMLMFRKMMAQAIMDNTVVGWLQAMV
jgi:hypothetical protein